MHSLGIVQWNSTRQDHPGNPRGVSESGPVKVNSAGFDYPYVTSNFGRS